MKEIPSFAMSWGSAEVLPPVVGGKRCAVGARHSANAVSGISDPQGQDEMGNVVTARCRAAALRCRAAAVRQPYVVIR